MNPPKFSLLLTFFLAGLGLVLWSTALPVHSQGSPATDLVLQKSVSPVTVLEPGDPIQYTLVFSNVGVLTATDVLITDTFPVLLTDVSVTSTLPLTPTGTAWAVGTLPPGAGGIITVTTTISPLLSSELTFTNTATITSPVTDTQPANNTSFVVSEINLPPVVDAGPDRTAFVDEPFTLNATFTDPGLDDTHTAEIAWGDLLTETLSSVTSPFTVTHVYTATDAFTVTLLVTDSDGGTGEDSLTVTVEERVYMRYLPLVNHYFGNPMNYVEVSPPSNSFLLPSQFSLSASYGSPETLLLPETVTTTSVILHSFQSGEMTGTLHVNGNSLTLTPSRLAHPGESFQATLSTEIGSLFFGGWAVLHPNDPTVWQFQTGVSGGSGYMGPASAPAFGSGDSTDLALGDLDRDGDWDVVVANRDSPATVWLNDGAGQFSPHPVTPELDTGDGQAVVLGDLDRDGDVDAIFAMSGAETVWLNDGLGNFSPHPTGPEFGSATSLDLALGDVNGDGKLDVLVANADNEPETVWLNDGTGAFIPHSTVPAFGEGVSTGIALGDVDGDFDLDAVVANDNGQPETVWLNDGTGGFVLHPSVPAFGAGDSQAVSLADLDSDGDADAVIANANGEAETVWLNDGTGSFTPHPTLPVFGAGNSVALAVGDVDGDLDLDVVVANGGNEPESVWLNDGLGGFADAENPPAFGAGESMAVALGDLDGDGDLDAVVANNGAETVWRNEEMEVLSTQPGGNGGIVQDGKLVISFDYPVDPTSVQGSSFVVHGSLTGVYTGSFSFPTLDQVAFTPAQPFKPGERLLISLTRAIESTPLNLPLAPYVWEARVRSEAGTATFAPASSENLIGQSTVVLGDMDQDGDVDYVMSGISWYPHKSEKVIWENDGLGSFPSTIIIDDSMSFCGETEILLGDLNNDGRLDLLQTCLYGSVIHVWLNQGNGDFTYQ